MGTGSVNKMTFKEAGYPNSKYHLLFQVAGNGDPPQCLSMALVRLRDSPEFLCNYHYGFCLVIPPNLKVEMLLDMSVALRTVANYAALIKPGFKKVSLFLVKLQSAFEVRVNVLLT